MDYILTHTLVYGIIGGVFVYYLAYCKLLQISIGATFIGLAFALAKFFGGNELEGGFLALGLLGFYTILQWIMLRFFPHQSQRDIFSIMFTLGAALVIENTLGLLFGSAPVSLSTYTFSTSSLIFFILCGIAVVWYVFEESFIGKIFTAARESHSTTKSLGIPLGKFLLLGSWGWFLLLIFGACIAVQSEGIKTTDGLFYLLIGIGIMVACGTRGMRGIFLISGAYALIEYMLFVTLGTPIAYKAGLMISIVLIILLVKPEGLFSFSRRQV